MIIGLLCRFSGGDYGNIEAISIIDQPQPMYNLTVDEAHTFFLGDGLPFFPLRKITQYPALNPTKLFLTALDRVWKETHTLIELVSAGTVCDDESCCI